MKDDIFEGQEIEDIEKKAFFGTFEHSKKPLGILFGLYKGNYGKLLGSVFFYLIQYLPVIMLPIITANIINIATDFQNHSLTELVWNGVFMLIVTLANIPGCYFSTKLRSIATRRVEALLRSTMSRKLQMLSITFWKEMESGRMQSKIMRDVESIEDLSKQLLSTALSVVITVIPAIIVTATKNRIVLLFFLAMIPFAILMMVLYRKKLRKTNYEYRSVMESTTASVNEMVELLPVTKAHALEKTAMDRFNSQFFRVADKGYELDRTNALFGATYWVVFQIFSLLCLCFTGTLAYKQIIEIGDVVMYQTYFSQVISGVSTVVSLLPALAKGFESVRSVGDIMWAMVDEGDSEKQKVKKVEGGFKFEDVRFWYPDDQHPILKGFNMEVKPGETVALVGESGSGKSTVLNMIIGFYRPGEGRVLLDGVDMNELDLPSYRTHIATVPQTSILFKGTVRDNITYGLSHYTEEDVKEAIRAANLEEVIEKLPQGIDTNVGEHGDKLSGGQRQRIAIARAVIRKASVIIFDEATSALDSASEKLIQDAIDRVSKGRTTFIVAHRLSTIKNADKIIVIKDGVCAECGTYDELMELKGEFYKFKELQN